LAATVPVVLVLRETVVAEYEQMFNDTEKTLAPEESELAKVK
jgi:hypothetical protein